MIKIKKIETKKIETKKIEIKNNLLSMAHENRKTKKFALDYFSKTKMEKFAVVDKLFIFITS